MPSLYVLLGGMLVSGGISTLLCILLSRSLNDEEDVKSTTFPPIGKACLKCVFPFEFEGKWYDNTCAPMGSVEICATQVNASGSLLLGSHEICENDHHCPATNHPSMDSPSNQSSGACNPSWIGDGFCDDINNVAACQHDNGDCCDPDASHELCSECLCLSNSSLEHESNSSFLACNDLSWIKDGFCDDQNNNFDCDYDGGDCCNANASHEFCTDCQCLTPDGTTMPDIFPDGWCKSFNPNWIGDGFCDDDHNNPSCKYDQGDCCNSNASHEFCTICLCLDPLYTVSPNAKCNHILWIGDDVCDDETNNALCLFDGGDCCKPYSNYVLCKVCSCLKLIPLHGEPCNSCLPNSTMSTIQPNSSSSEAPIQFTATEYEWSNITSSSSVPSKTSLEDH